MNKILTAFLISLCCGCGKSKPQFATDEEYKSKGWHSCAMAVRNINGVKFICWSDSDWEYYSNTVNGVVSRKEAK
jgi:hypothetical protein